ncbi:MAG: nucleotidyltransferase domain-containing protein [Candidatus Acidiferrum sp.]
MPLGTQIVTRVDTHTPEGNLLQMAGAVAVILQVPSDTRGEYRVRFPDGAETSLRRTEFQVRKELAKTIGTALGTSQADLYGFVIYRCIVGSRAYGLEEESSDIDRRGIYLPPADLQWSLLGVPEQLERQETQECYWELEKFLRLALRANPNVLECLYTPLVEEASPVAEELLAMRDCFLTKQVYQTYNGYVISQFKKLGKDLRNKGAIRWKHAMHLVRLLLSGITILMDGAVPVRVGHHRDRLLAIRRGKESWQEVNVWRKELHREFDAAWAKTKLPEHPDYDRVNAFLVKARRSKI